MSDLLSASASLRDARDADLLAAYDCERFTLTILSSRFEYVIEHVCSQLLTNAFTPLIRDYYDFSATLSAGPALDYTTPTVAKTLALHFGSMRDGVANACEEFGVENLRPGDLLVCNDPFRAGTHVNDLLFMRPIFLEGELITVITIRAHLVDVGGVVPGGYSGTTRNLYEAGIVIPPTLLYHGDNPVRSTFSLLMDNTRFGAIITPDIVSISHSLRLGERLIVETIERYGLASYLGAIRYSVNASAERMREGLARIPDGDYGAVGYIDCDGIDRETAFRIQVNVRVRGSRAEVDFSGTSEQSATTLNCAWPDVKSSVSTALKFLLDPVSPYTSAVLRDVDIVLPSGTLISCEPPASTIIYSEPMTLAFAVVCRALQEVLGPDALADDSRATHILNVSGQKADGSPFLGIIAPMGGWGANKAGDADSGQHTYMSNFMAFEVESTEAGTPVIQLRKEYITDSAGPGAFRGGAGVVNETLWLTDNDQQTIMPAAKSPNGIGVHGGREGAPASIRCWHDVPVNGATMQTSTGSGDFGKATLIAGLLDPETGEYDAEGEFFFWCAEAPWRFGPNTLVRCSSGGGGGWGDPFERDPALVMRDVRDEYLTVERAAADYGVVVVGDPATDPEGLAVNEAATRELRAAGAPPAPDREAIEAAAYPVLAPPLEVERQPVEEACPDCGGAAERYPVLAEGGWRQVVKCTSCLASLEREPWSRLGSIQLLEDTLLG